MQQENVALLLWQRSESQRFDPPSGLMQYWREEQSPRGAHRGCCRLLRHEKEGSSLDIQRQQATTSLDILPLIANEPRQSPDLCPSKPIKSAERQHPSRVSGRQREGVKQSPSSCALQRRPPSRSPRRQGVSALPPALFISPLPLPAETLSDVCERQPPTGNKRGELACRYIVAVTWWRQQITEARGSEGNSGHFLTRGQEIDTVSCHSNHDRQLNGKPHFHHALTQVTVQRDPARVNVQ